MGEDILPLDKKYTVDAIKKKGDGDCWDTLEVKIFRLENNNKIQVGSYERNYWSLYNTFFPFVKDGKEYALYSPHYMYTRVMELPSCKDLGGEDNTNLEYPEHFCPVDYHVPIYRKVGYNSNDKEKIFWLTEEECFENGLENSKYTQGPIQYCDFGLVAGCVWGDDSSWKVQFLDLLEIDKGIIKRDERFGYVELAPDSTLKDSLDMSFWSPESTRIGIRRLAVWDYKTKGIIS